MCAAKKHILDIVELGIIERLSWVGRKFLPQQPANLIL
jgi:hypothetical protein